MIALNPFSRVTNLHSKQMNAWMDRDMEGAHDIAARARPHDGLNSHQDGTGPLHRGTNGCTTIVFAGRNTQDHVSERHTFITLFSYLCHCNLAWSCKLYP